MQLSLSELEYSSKKKVRRRDILVALTEAVKPWDTLEEQ